MSKEDIYRYVRYLLVGFVLLGMCWGALTPVWERIKPIPYADPSINTMNCRQWGESERGVPGGLYWRDPMLVCLLRDRTDPARPASRVVVQGWEGALPDTGIRVVKGKCEDDPEAACITVRHDHNDTRGLGVMEDFRPSDRLITIVRQPEGTFCHELLHGLGLSHHWKGGGCLQAGRTENQPSTIEKQVLAAWYAR